MSNDYSNESNYVVKSEQRQGVLLSVSRYTSVLFYSIIFSTLLLPGTATANEQLPDGVWTGRVKSAGNRHCGYSIRPATGVFKNDAFELKYKDGLSVERNFVARVNSDGHFTAHKVIPAVMVGWIAGAPKKDTVISGQFQNSLFTATLAPSSDGVGCRASFILFPGQGHAKKEWATLVSERDGQRLRQVKTQNTLAPTTIPATNALVSTPLEDEPHVSPVPVSTAGELNKKLAVLKNLVDEGVILESEAAIKRQLLLDAASPTDNTPLAQLTRKLEALKTLVDGGLITETEAAEKRQALLDTF